MFGQGTGFDANGAPQWPQAPPPLVDDPSNPDMEEGDNSHRPPNAFILYTQAMRSEVRQENPSLSNTEVSRLLGKMWKEVPNDIKLQYKQRAAKMQEEFKKQHPDYTYRKARRKRALNELLTKSTQGFPGPLGYPDQYMYQMNYLSGLPGMGGMPGMPNQPNGQMPFAGFQNAQGLPQMGGMPQQMNGNQPNMPGMQNGQPPPNMFSMPSSFPPTKSET